MTIWDSPLTPGLTFSVELVGPELAKTWLDSIKVVQGDIRIQRKPVEKRIQRYAFDMQHGQFPFAGDPVRFSAVDPDTGIAHLIDGQHRLRAIIDCGIAQPMLVIRGLPLALIQQFDIGARRTFVNYLQMHGVKNPGIVGTITTALHHWDNGLFGTKAMARVRYPIGLNVEPTHAELFEKYENETNLRTAALRAMAAYRTTNQHTMTRTQFGLMWMLFGRVDPYKREAFFTEFISDKPPVSIAPGYPITVLGDRLRRRGTRELALADAAPRWQWLAHGIEVWNAWYDGEPIKQLRSSGSRWDQLPKVRGLEAEDLRFAAPESESTADDFADEEN